MTKKLAAKDEKYSEKDIDKDTHLLEQTKIMDDMKSDYTFDDKFFDNIEKIGAFPPITN